MSDQGLTDEEDNTLLNSPWQGKRDQHGRTNLFKYQSTNDGRSFVLAITNLESIHVHTPKPEDIPAVPWEVDHPFLLSTQDLIRDSFPDEPLEQIQGLVEKISTMFEERWDEVQLLIEQENGVKVAYMRIDDFAWRFILSQLASSQSIPFLIRHLLHPAITIISNDRSIPIPLSTSTSKSIYESTSRLISDPEIMRAIRRSTFKPLPSTNTSSQGELKSSSQFPSSIDGSPTPRKPPRTRIEQNRKDVTPSSSMPPSSPPKILSSSVPPEEEDEHQSSPPPFSNDRPSSSSGKGFIPTSSSVVKSSSPSIGSAMDFKPPTQSQNKSKKEREKEEEEAIEKRMKDMKRKMEKGGGGKLGKRRLAR
ncbi:uncharacterized protein I206_101370 [Kwoniella pini CBS 10737]|uniref:Uncharacterized protein n=1 Tax=Kwoniella pini CBS 10737 TaxID=1296096 RepID=A0A1B9HWV9_9TREE|nr:uncharacterized protein I206_06661 [Kwoniella pini CBS 10737]OCF47754.1 hypothetical protein I206_06661 [Kwoniella pini CBS 10737]